MDEVLATAAELAGTAEVELIQGPSFPAQLYPQGLAIEGSLESLVHCCQGLGAAFNPTEAPAILLQATSGRDSRGEFQTFLQGLNSLAAFP